MECVLRIGISINASQLSRISTEADAGISNLPSGVVTTVRTKAMHPGAVLINGEPASLEVAGGAVVDDDLPGWNPCLLQAPCNCHYQRCMRPEAAILKCVHLDRNPLGGVEQYLPGRQCILQAGQPGNGHIQHLLQSLRVERGSIPHTSVMGMDDPARNRRIELENIRPAERLRRGCDRGSRGGGIGRGLGQAG